MNTRFPTKSTFDDVVCDLDLSFRVTMLRHEPAELAALITQRIKLTAKYLARTSLAPHSKALEAVSQAVRFSDWHHLSTHLARALGPDLAKAPQAWLDALSSTLLVLVQPEADVKMPEAQLQAFERLGQTLGMLSDTPTQDVLDDVCAALCGGKNWQEVRNRSPLKARTALYQFLVDEGNGNGYGYEEASSTATASAGFFDWSPACYELVEELDGQWQGYDDFTKPQQKRARKWVEAALIAQPGFLEAGLALASMQYDAEEEGASATLERYIKQAEALIPIGFKGQILWSQVGNRFYHRMFWLRLEMHVVAGDLKSAVRLARKQLRLNPADNFGVRLALPLLLLELGDYPAAKRALKGLATDAGQTASAIRAFTEYAAGNQQGFRTELVDALISLPWLRVFLSGRRATLPDGDDGFRGMQPDLELFIEFASSAYGAVPGLMAACKSFLAEPLVIAVEAELRSYWMVYDRRDGQRQGSYEEWVLLCSDAARRLA
ncbi:hypothetical protein LNV09_14630 [Paucibacter sp. B2R-40]|uniref:hypothetical protein n=1 Tax=Paucibacter sp. B2R-40 TaxID=2893554 RepID=UPI0021E49EBC|nr:hypothetical protein [Paucibacter sp. B2R-40]MCV2355387.1 hypothetical protein [Paucibacter sp. B2R-40]